MSKTPCNACLSSVSSYFFHSNLRRPDLFDQWAAAATPAAQVAQVPEASEAPAQPEAPTPTPATPAALRRAVQELLKNGVLEQAAKPPLFRHIAIDTARVNALLEPLGLQVRVDDLRGLAYVTVAPGWQAGEAEDDDEWTHPLVRRQRLTPGHIGPHGGQHQ